MGNGVNIPFSNILSVTKICPSLATLALGIFEEGSSDSSEVGGTKRCREPKSYNN